ncbi:putative F-box domain-containing protein [Rosa chinensis]|uniref:Putative F-box domain-containing protein n=1 Tax=Rosa chinensis TaxID=74649 RepID=A0A2P6SF67_ROSCH|nr:putative F-box domain-containing protein [Rosa chinensis]
MAEDGGGGHFHKQALISVTDLDGVLDEILARLSVKTLMRFYCVCKSWRALISQSHFFTKYCNYVSKGFTEKTSTLLISMSPLKSRDCEASKDLSLDCEALKELKDDGDAHLAIRKIKFPKLTRKTWCYGTLVLDNPICCQNLLIIAFRSMADLVSIELSSFFCGFGYDSTNDDYKVVRGYNHRVGDSEETVVQVFSLKSGSWRTHEGLSYFGLAAPAGRPGCLLNGVCIGQGP